MMGFPLSNAHMAWHTHGAAFTSRQDCTALRDAAGGYAPYSAHFLCDEKKEKGERTASKPFPSLSVQLCLRVGDSKPFPSLSPCALRTVCRNSKPFPCACPVPL